MGGMIFLRMELRFAKSVVRLWWKNYKLHFGLLFYALNEIEKGRIFIFNNNNF